MNHGMPVLTKSDVFFWESSQPDRDSLSGRAQTPGFRTNFQNSQDAVSARACVGPVTGPGMNGYLLDGGTLGEGFWSDDELKAITTEIQTGLDSDFRSP